MMRTLLLLLVCTACTTYGTGAAPGDAVAGDATHSSLDSESTPDSAAAVDAPPRSAVCGKFDDGVYGKKHPWSGFVQAGKTYTCNECRGGYPGDQGMWRLIDFKTENPATSLGDYRETLTFDGNTWHEHIAGDDQGKQVDATIDGWFWCADTSELNSGKAVFIAETVVPPGAWGMSVGAFTADIKSNGDNLRAIGFDTAFDGGTHAEYIYCRVGSVINGVACSDPFQK